MRSILEAALQVANTNATVLILGETGTGKERLAQKIHAASPRSKKPFITINCATLPASLAESLLFGHIKGAFTGADYDHLGLIQAANGGTLFLDEIGELPLALQGKLLRFLESSEILSIGKTKTQKVDVRIITATHCDLKQMVQAKQFRQDLFFRLNIIPITLPPLRERPEDIKQFIESFLTRFARQHNCTVCTLTEEALTVLEKYNWPGNIRELRNLCEHLSILRAGCEINAIDLPNKFHTQPSQTNDSSLFILPEEGINLESMEKELLNQALERTQQNKAHAARLLGISRDAINYRIKKTTT